MTTFKDKWTGKTYTVEEFTERELHDVFADGQIEQLSSNLDRTASAFARLMQTLANKGVLDKSDVHQIVCGYKGEE